MRKLQNTLYITTQGSYLHKERETLVVEQERKKVAQLPVHSIGHIFCFGNVLVSPFLLGFCGENNVNLAFFTENGRFLGRLQGRQSGNVLLRRAQYRVSEQNPVPIARNIIAAKIQAGKRVLQRQIRNYGENAAIQSAVDSLNISLRQLKGADGLDVVRGIEGDAAARYFGVFGQLLNEKSGFSFDGRNRRPPRDGVNALLSFVYSLLGKDISGAVSLKADARKLLFQTLQAKKQEKIVHPFLGEEVEIGLLPYIQAILLARHLRGDLAEYPPFLMR